MLTESMKEKSLSFYQEHPVLSMAHFPHPLTNGGIIIIFEANQADFLSHVGAAYQRFASFGSLYCLRPDEIFQLTYGGLFAPPFHINEHPHLLHYLKNKGQLLAGQEFRANLQPAYHPDQLLSNHLEACRDSMRRYGIMPHLLNQSYAPLLSLINQEAKHLMATALLRHGVWEINLDTIIKSFAHFYPGLISTVTDLSQTRPAQTEEAALDALFTFEGFLAKLSQTI